MIKLGVTDHYKLLVRKVHEISSNFEDEAVLFTISSPDKLMQDLLEQPVDVLFASQALLHCITVPFYGLLKENFPEIRIVIFNLFDQQRELCGTLNAQEIKHFERDKKMSIRTAKEIYIGPHIVFHEEHDPDGFLEKVKLFRQGKYTFNDVVYISLREKDIIKLAAQELCGKEIAEKLNISLRTVEVHKKNLMARTNSKNFVGVILYALMNRVMTLEEIYN
ncbi:response regulator transcription factor [Sphingobacterium sp. JUb56]|uniref:response regulator transcription factor n=1 Tax=Sphingobacterium sp. JUb56 TaxID=2587145 RepID=UPI001622708B|nr:LuxR C-terminal-related transcriptional regulator [Sphingobacterium sp. JUb56]MBB2951215.1 DNA-binding NarL/FixJ family response regulator [Sphingobacterium sp. JUb56]